MSDIISAPSPATTVVPEKTDKAPGFDWRAAISTPEGKAVLVLLAGLVFAFGPFWIKVSEQWFEADSLYSHGPLIPLMAAYIIYERWPKLREIPVKGFAPAIVLLVPVMYLTWFASRTVMLNTLSTTFMLALMLSVLFVGGWRWLLATIGPILFLVFSLPYWSSIVDRVTQPLQALSTDMALQILNLSGLHTMRADTTTVYLDNFHFTVAAACSGAKTTLALLAFAFFFILLGRGRWYSAVALLALLIPFSLLLNGLRIALVGIIGNGISPAAGMAFHDYGAYGLLVVGFLALGQLARLLGFKQ